MRESVCVCVCGLRRRNGGAAGAKQQRIGSDGGRAPLPRVVFASARAPGWGQGSADLMRCMRVDVCISRASALARVRCLAATRETGPSCAGVGQCMGVLICLAGPGCSTGVPGVWCHAGTRANHRSCVRVCLCFGSAPEAGAQLLGVSRVCVPWHLLAGPQLWAHWEANRVTIVCTGWTSAFPLGGARLACRCTRFVAA